MDNSNSRDIQLQIGALLLIGILVSATLVLIGGIYYLMSVGHENIFEQTFYSQKPQPLTLHHMLAEALSLTPFGIIQFGVFLLVVTQLFRVILAAWYFAKIRDKLFVGISLFVLIVVSYSLFYRF